MFEPRLDILPDSQRLLWPELDAAPSDFVLYGGTALALHGSARARILIPKATFHSDQSLLQRPNPLRRFMAMGR